jgi:MerR family mercuric resistance operon transcriptional regulator
MDGITIGKLAEAGGVGIETVRYYQRRGLLDASGPRRGAYRIYDATDVTRLRFIRRAQALGFSLDEIGGLLSLNEESDRDSARAAARAKITDIDNRIHQLQEIKSALTELVSCCERTDAPTPCPILKALGEHD